MKLSEIQGTGYLPPENQPLSLARYVSELIERSPEHSVVELDARGNGVETRYHEFLKRASALMPRIRNLFTDPEEATVVLCYRSVTDFLPAALATLFLGCRCIYWPTLESRFDHRRFRQQTLDFADRLPNRLILGDREILQLLRDPPLTDGPFLDTTAPESTTGITGERVWSDAAEILIPTSGTSRAPKLAVQDRESLINRFFVNNRTPYESFLSTLPHHSALGISLLIPNFPRTICIDPLTLHRNPLQHLEIVDRFGISAIGVSSSFMAQVNRLASESKPAVSLASLRCVVFGMEVIVPKVARQFIGHLRGLGAGDFRVLLNYAMTETGWICREEMDPDEFLNRFKESDDVMIHGCCESNTVQVCDEEGRVLPEGRTGHIRVHSSGKMFKGYFDPRSGRSSGLSEDGWFDTGDRGYMKNGAIAILGRETHTLFANARKISCEEIEALVRSMAEPALDQVVAAPMRPPGGHTDELVLFLVAASTRKGGLSTDEARDLARQTGSRLAIPVRHAAIVESHQIELNASQKISRRRMIERYLGGEWPNVLETRTVPIAAARSDLEREFQMIWKRALNLSLTPDPSIQFFELGGDSIALFQCLNDIEDQFGVLISLEEFLRSPSVDGLVSLIDSRRNG